MGPETVRALRGGLSRASFAKHLQVTPHTVYRWELPDGSKEARRPRGAELERLASLAARRTDRGGAPSESMAQAERLAGTENVGAPEKLALSERSSATPGSERLADVLGALDRVLRGDWMSGRAELLRILANARAEPLDVLALAAVGLAIVDVALRSDPRSAIATLSPALRDAEEDRLAPHVAAYVHAAAACVHALPDATLFDVGRVHAHAARAEALAQGQIPEIAFLAWLGTLHVAVTVADEELLQRAFARLDVATTADLPPLLALHELEARALRAKFAGQRALGARFTEELIESAAARGYPLLHARALAFSAVGKLDELDAPETVLALARRSAQIATAARASAGAHVAFAARAEAEALLRLGRAEEAVAALGELAAYTVETKVPPIQAAATEARVRYVTGRYDAMSEISARLRACEVASLKPICQAIAAYVDALQMLGTSSDPEGTAEAFERAAESAGRWTFLLRDVLVWAATAHVVVGTDAPARAALRRAQRLLDRFPSPWASAHLRRAEGTHVAVHGRWAQGRQLIESAIGTFESGGDLVDAALAGHLLAALAQAFEEPDARDRVESSEARLAGLGLRAPGAIRAGVERILAARRSEGARPDEGGEIARLVAPIQRLAVRGAEPALVLREILRVAGELVPGKGCCLEELDSQNEARVIGGEAEGPSSAFEWIEFGDGCGRRLRLGVRGALGEDARATLSIVAITAGLALEVATLRSAGAARAETSTEDEGEVPGFVAVSAPMRALRSEIVHLAGSRATVVIQGESGTGKEIVARAIHDRSTRARMPYVAFNCAAIPRDLFEGQLFGFRRGAFTGAARDQPGVLRAAEGGTIFLDEIGELPLDVQPKLLRFLENGEIFALGDERPTHVDVRVIAATHRDLGALVREGRFREDLYYRLQVVALRIAPLRDRREDIAPLARHFLRLLSAAEAPPILAPDALAKLAAYPFPGNVRELRNALERALAYAPPPRVIRAEHLVLGGGLTG
ncbi:MAG: sigma-54 dependent transcriptional regulator [Polyangiaceae bacterium]